MLHQLLQPAFHLGSMFAFGNGIGTCSDLIHFNPQIFYSRADLSFPILYLCSVIEMHSFFSFPSNLNPIFAGVFFSLLRLFGVLFLDLSVIETSAILV